MGFFESTPQPEPVLPAEPEWIGPPRNVLGVPVPFGALLARTDETAVSIGPLTAYPAGFELRLRLRLRHDEPCEPMPFHPQKAGPGALRFGVLFADGRRATNGARPRGQTPERPTLVMRGGSGGQGSWDWGFWIWGLPPAGELAFVCEWTSRGIAESRAHVDAQPILHAAGQAEELWPVG